MTATTYAPAGITDHELQVLTDRLAAQLRPVATAVKGKGFSDGVSTAPAADGGPVRDKAWWNDVFEAVGKIAPVVITALSGQKALTDMSEADQKSFWDTVASIAHVVLPAVAAFAGAKGIDDDDSQAKDWLASLLQTVTTIAPPIIAAIAGQKELSDDHQKNLVGDIVGVLGHVLPIALSFL